MFIPAFLQLAQVFAVFLETVITAGLQAVSLVYSEFDGWPYGKITAHGGIHGDQRAHGGGFGTGIVLEDAIQNGFAVLAFTDLKINCVIRGGDVVTLRIDHVYRRFMAGYLASDDEARLDINRTAAVFFLLLATDITDVFRRVAHQLEGHKRLLCGVFDVTPDLRDHGLRGGQVAGRQQHELALAGDAEAVHFAVGTDIVNARVGTGIGNKHNAGFKADGQAIGHDLTGPHRCYRADR